MPRHLTSAQQKEKHNMYLSNLTKAEFYKKLKELGLPSLTGSAAIRALMSAFIDGVLDNTDIVDRIKAEIIITPNGKTSKL